MVMVIEQLHHYLFGRSFTVHTDHSPLVQIFAKQLNVSPRLQCMLLRLSQYQFDVKYVSQKHVPLADCLSRLCSNNSEEDPSLDIQIAELYNGCDPMNVDWNTIREQTMRDVKLVKVPMAVQNGWPESCKSLDADWKSYWPHRHAISIIDGVIVLGNRIIIPAKLRSIVLREMLDAHLGIVKTKLHTRQFVFWPGINADIEQLCKQCERCRKNQLDPPFSPNTSATVEAHYPGEVYGTDVVDIQGKHHLVVINYYSTCIFEHPFPSLTSASIILAFKTIFADTGIPTKLIADNARYFVSEEFDQFSKRWNFEHSTSSPRYPRGNAHAEKAVQAVKSVYEKSSDILIGMLALKTATIVDPEFKDSPDNIFFGHQLCTTTPVVHRDHPKHLQCCLNQVRDMQQENRSFKVGDSVWVKFSEDQTWMKAVVSQVLEHDPYVVETNEGRVLQRNVHHLTPRCVDAEPDNLSGQDTNVMRSKQYNL